ncbi:MAG TPA: DUF4214 domain-containing protein, partial [Planctomycetota bacterium]|nr:DUF4214 domain-containing protein [Planctomycetota bacterium]
HTDNEEGHGIAVDVSGNIFVTGWTLSSSFPTTPGAFDTTLSAQEAFVTRLTAGGAVVWSTLLGGDANDVGWDVAIDREGNVVVVGETRSDNFDTTDGFDTTWNTNDDAFVTVFVNDGSLLWSSYLGGSGNDYAYGVDVNSASAIYITGKTESGDFPDDGGFDTSLGGTLDAFAMKVEALTEPYYARHPLLFAQDCYTGFLRRAAEPAGAAYFADQIEHYGMEYRECAAFFLTSAEFETWVAPIVRLYRAYLDRTPDGTGLNAYVNAIKAGVPMTVIAWAFAHSPEFIALHGDIYNTTTNGQFVTWLYNAVLKRAPAPAEVAAWQAALDNAWLTREALMVAFSQSAEYAAAQSNVVHGTLAILGLLGRPGNDFEIGLLTTALGGGASLSDVCGFVMDTHEYQTHTVKTDFAIPGPVVRLYEGLLDRSPDYGGLVAWTDGYIEGYPLTAIAYGFITSAEVTGTYGDVYYGYTNAQYVTWLYNRVLGRAPAPAEVAAWQPALDGGTMTREELALAFTESPEYQAATAGTVTTSTVFPMLLGRMSDRAERAYWETALGAGVTANDMIDLVVVL